MSINWVKIVVSFLLILSGRPYEAMAEGGSVGNGGGAWTCRDVNQELKWIKFVDFYEATNEFGLDLENESYLTPQDYLNQVLSKVKIADRTFYYALKASLEKVKSNIKFVENSDLAVIDDALFRITPSNSSCIRGKIAYEQVANYTIYGKILLNSSLFSRLDVQEQAGLYLYEAVYLLERNRKGATNSVVTRSLVGLLMSQVNILDYANKLLKYGPELQSKECDICAMGGVEVRRFSDGLGAFKGKNGWGYMDRTGKTIIEPQFLEAREFHEGIAAVGYSDEWGGGTYQRDISWKFIDKFGKTIFDTKYWVIPGDFENGLAQIFAPYPKEEDGNLVPRRLNAVINSSGEIIVDFQEPYINVHNGLVVLRDESEKSCKYLNSKKEIVIRLDGYDYCRGFNEGLAVVYKNEKVGFVNWQGHVVIEPKFQHAYDFVGDYAVVSEKEGSFGLIGKDGKYVIQPFNASGAFNFNSVVVARDYKLKGGKHILTGVLNLKGDLIFSGGADSIRYSGNDLSEPFLIPVQDGIAWGYMNLAGEMVIEPQFSQADYFYEGFAATNKGFIRADQIK